MIKKLYIFLTGIMLMSSFCGLTACGDNKVVLTTGFGSNEVFKVGSEKATTTELTLYLTNIANQYEQVYGEDLWAMPVSESATMWDSCKELALAQLAQVKAMKLLAKEHEVTLTEEEQTAVSAAAGMYLATLSETEKEVLGILKGEVLEQIYSEKLLADKLYAYLIRDVNPEISDDEARIITVQHILLKTYTVDDHGNREELSQGERDKLYQKAQDIYQLAIDGESFDALISKYSDDTKGTYSFGMGEMEAAFEKAAFSLATDEIAPVVKTNHGYHIIKCISTLDREQTDLNKVKLLISRKQEVFGDTYNRFVSELDKQENTEVLNTLTIPEEDVDTADLFTIYESELGTIFE